MLLTHRDLAGQSGIIFTSGLRYVVDYFKTQEQIFLLLISLKTVK